MRASAKGVFPKGLPGMGSGQHTTLSLAGSSLQPCELGVPGSGEGASQGCRLEGVSH